MIKSLKKRRELAEMVYARYGGLSKEEKPEYENEVGVAFEAYEKAINDACEWLGKNLSKYSELTYEDEYGNKLDESVMNIFYGQAVNDFKNYMKGE